MKQWMVYLIFFIFPTAFADYGVKFDVNPENVLQGEQLTAQIEIENFGDVVIKKLDIEGIDNFQILSKSQSSQVLVENQVVITQTKVELILLAKNAGTFLLGPVHLELGKDTKIDIDGKNIVVNPKSQALGVNHKDDVLSEGNDFFYENKDISPSILYSSLTGYIIGFGVFLGVFYFFLMSYLGHLNLGSKKEVIHVQEIIEDDLQEEIQDLEKNISTFDRSLFYAKFNSIFRKALSQKFGIDFDAQTYSDIFGIFHEKHLSLPDFFEQTYEEEYRQKSDSQEFRKKTLGELKKFVKT